MKTSLEVLYTPADFAGIAAQDLRSTWCVVFDVLRATSSMVTALAHGATEIRPAADIPEALEAHRRCPDALLAGERLGLRITRDLTGSIDFDLGNSPREFTPDKVRGRRIIMTTTNGTRALRACAKAERVLVCSFLNLSATAAFIRHHLPSNLLLVCSGTFEQAAAEDVLCAGATADQLWDLYGSAPSDGAFLARRYYLTAGQNLAVALCETRNGNRLLHRPELSDDVQYCANRDALPLVVEQRTDGVVARVQPGEPVSA